MFLFVMVFCFFRKVLASYQVWAIMADQRMVVSDGTAVVMSIYFYLRPLTHFRYETNHCTPTNDKTNFPYILQPLFSKSTHNAHVTHRHKTLLLTKITGVIEN